MAGFLARIAAFADDDSGATAIEYGLIAGLIAVAIIASMSVFGNGLSNMFNGVSSRSGVVLETQL